MQTIVNKKQAPGDYTVKWNGKNNNNQKVAPGIYYYRLENNNYRMTKSLIIN